MSSLPIFAQEALRLYLRLGFSAPGNLVHFAAMGLLAVHRESTKGDHRYDDPLTEGLESWVSSANIARVQEMMMYPNLEGIIILPESEKCVRDVDVSQSMVIGDTGYDKSWVTDNASPKPRHWTLRGKIESTIYNLDDLAFIKPTIDLQLATLDAFATSRLPIWYKTYYGEYVQVLVSNVTYEHVPDYSNVVSVTLDLIEFIALTSIPVGVGGGTFGYTAVNQGAGGSLLTQLTTLVVGMAVADASKAPLAEDRWEGSTSYAGIADEPSDPESKPIKSPEIPGTDPDGGTSVPGGEEPAIPNEDGEDVEGGGGDNTYGGENLDSGALGDGPGAAGSLSVVSSSDSPDYTTNFSDSSNSSFAGILDSLSNGGLASLSSMSSGSGGAGLNGVYGGELGGGAGSGGSSGPGGAGTTSSENSASSYEDTITMSLSDLLSGVSKVLSGADLSVQSSPNSHATPLNSVQQSVVNQIANGVNMSDIVINAPVKKTKDYLPDTNKGSAFYSVHAPSATAPEIKQPIALGNLMLQSRFSYPVSTDEDAALLGEAALHHYDGMYVVDRRGVFKPIYDRLKVFSKQATALVNARSYLAQSVVPMTGASSRWEDAWIFDDGLEQEWRNGYVYPDPVEASNPWNPTYTTPWDNGYAAQYGTPPDDDTANDDAWIQLITRLSVFVGTYNAHEYVLSKKAEYEILGEWIKAAVEACREHDIDSILVLMDDIPNEYTSYLYTENLYVEEIRTGLLTAQTNKAWTLYLTDANNLTSAFVIVPGVWYEHLSGQWRVMFVTSNMSDVSYSRLGSVEMIFEVYYIGSN